jgi:PAT family beta-lactamase induction signal transducer AmpG
MKDNADYPAGTHPREPLLRQIFLNPRMYICIFLGLSSGMPLYVLYQLIPAWLRSQGLDLGTIGLFSLLTLPYNWKFLWSPFLDIYSLPWLGRRRGWMLIMQIALLCTIGISGFLQPQQHLSLLILVIVATAFFSATQDIIIDGYRRELLKDEELGLGNAIHVNAYRISSLVPGSLALILADSLPWSVVFPIVAAFMLVGVFMTLLIPETSDETVVPQSLRAAIVDPFKEFFSRKAPTSALLLLAFIILYKLGDNMAVALQTPIFLDLGYTLTEIGSVAKAANLSASIIGGIVGGVLMLRMSIARALWIFGLIQMSSILGYAYLAAVPPALWLLFTVNSFEYFGVGLGTAALTAFIALQTSRSFSVTQLAILLSFATLARTLASAWAGFIIEELGYTNFFFACFILAFPGMILLFWVAPLRNGQ